ncbi:MAG: EAL domain-containing protein [Candidatus Aquirickettsiella gammari]
MLSKVLIVEDESIVALDLQRRLMRLGYDVPRVAASCEQALQAIHDTLPNIVLMDINISGDIDGIDTAAKIDLPVIFLTAYSEESTLQRAKESKPYGYLVKPFSERELHATIQMALERYQVENRLKMSENLLSVAYARMESAKRDLETHAVELFKEKQHLEVTLNSIGDGVITTDKLGNITYLNPVAEKKTGWSCAEAIGMSVTKILVLVDEETNVATPSPIEHTLRTGQTSGLAHQSALLHRNGEKNSIEDSTAPMYDRNNQIIGAVMVFHDISETRRLADEMTYQATHDALTDLVNRREFEKRLEKVVQGTLLHEQQHAVAYLDLDQFKIVNDTCGHNAGDELLRQITSLLRLALRANDTLARLGGDEFGVLLESCPPHISIQIAEKLRNIVSDFHFSWDGKTFPISVSIGLVNFGGIETERQSIHEILHFADSACYTAKDLGRNRIHTYRSEDNAIPQRHGELDWYTKIRSALTENRLVLYSQTIKPLQQTKPNHTHAEILLRIVNQDGKIIPPMAFIPAAERYGLMPEIDRWVVKNSFDYIAKLSAPENSLFSINLSGGSLNDEKALSYICEQLTSSGARPESICFEITETAAIANLMNARAFILTLKEKGCQFALDDFGSGMSSFAYLKHLPVDYLKIDGCFVKDIISDTVDAAMVDAINQIAHVMGLKTIAEFAETQLIVDLLRSMGVDYAQGYGVDHPTPLLPERLN